MKKFIFTLLLMLPLSLMAQKHVFMGVPVIGARQFSSALIEKGFVKVEPNDSIKTDIDADNVPVLKGKFLEEEVDVSAILQEGKMMVIVTFYPKEGLSVEDHTEKIVQEYKKASGIEIPKQGNSYIYIDNNNMSFTVVTPDEEKVLMMYFYAIQ